jgi:hypothetical protein
MELCKMKNEKETVRMTLEIPKDWVIKKKAEAKEQGKVWSVFAREEILKAIQSKKFTR